MIQTINDIVIRVKIGMGTSAHLITEEGYNFAAAQALAELSYGLPLISGIHVFWSIKRTKRHALFILYTESANRFQYKQIRLNHRWDHYHKMIEAMDKEFEKAMTDNWFDFLTVSPEHIFGTKIDAGFAYDKFGRERTYDFSNFVDFTPKGNTGKQERHIVYTDGLTPEPTPAPTQVSEPSPTYNVVVEWDDSQVQENVAGYNLYVGDATRNYTQEIDVGKNLFATIALEYNKNKYIAATTYGEARDESTYSEELVVYNGATV